MGEFKLECREAIEQTLYRIFTKKLILKHTNQKIQYFFLS